jgi:chitinase
MLDEEFPDEHVLITAAVSTQGFRDVDRHYLSRLDDGWAEFMDAFYIMVKYNYIMQS